MSKDYIDLSEVEGRIKTYRRNKKFKKVYGKVKSIATNVSDFMKPLAHEIGKMPDAISEEAKHYAPPKKKKGKSMFDIGF
jgi:hypothetical protein